jgi:hypothetical protein
MLYRLGSVPEKFLIKTTDPVLALEASTNERGELDKNSDLEDWFSEANLDWIGFGNPWFWLLESLLEIAVQKAAPAIPAMNDVAIVFKKVFIRLFLRSKTKNF